MKKSLLLIGGSLADIPIIKAAKALGLYVITTGHNPHDFGHVYADEYHMADYSNPDNIYQLAKSLNVTALCPSSNDFSAIACAYACEKLGFKTYDNYETSLILHHKDKFRTFALQNKISVPKAITVNKTTNLSNIALPFPLIVKPIDLSGGKGITKVLSHDELQKAIILALSISEEPTIVVEEFIEGSNHGYCTFLKDQKVSFAFMDDEYYYKNKYLVAGAATSTNYNKTLSQKLNKELEQIASKLNLVDGLFHVQFIIKNNVPYIIEVCRRTPGDLYVKLVEYATKFNLSQAIVNSALNNDIKVNSFDIQYIIRHCVMSERNGVIKDINYHEYNNIFDKMTLYTRNDPINNYLTYKAEIDFIKFNTKAELKKALPLISKTIKVELQS